MILKRTIIAKINSATGLILKQIETSNGIFNGRGIAINNTFYNAEKKRILFSKPLLSSLVHVHHIHYDNRNRKWRLGGQGEESLENVQAHAEENGRIFIAYLQMSKDQWERLTWTMAESQFQQIARKGIAVVPYPLPLNATVLEWEVRKEIALRVLNKSQELMPILCLFHDTDKFLPILSKEFREGKLLGIHYFNINETICQANIMALYELTFRKTVGTEVPLVIGLSPRRYISSYSQVSSVYLLSLLGIDFTSYYVLKPEQLAKIDEQAPEEYRFYDSSEGGYNNSSTQIAWYGRELTRANLERISANEGLDPYMANYWADFMRECEDLDVLNSCIINDTALAFIEEKSRWHTAFILLPRRTQPT